MSEPSRQSLRGLTLTVLIPCLLFSAALAGWITYRDLYRVILNHGFEEKLVAVSTGVAAFIDGEAHLTLSRASRVTALAADPAQPVLWGLDEGSNDLVRVDMVSGGASQVGPTPRSGLTALAYDVPRGVLVAAHGSSGELVSFAPGAEQATALGRIDPGVRDLALDVSGTQLVAVGPWGLRGYVRGSQGGAFAPAWAMEELAQGVAISPETGALFVLMDDGRLQVAAVPGAPLVDRGSLVPGDEEGGPAHLSDITGLTATPLTPMLFGAATRLVAISPDEVTFQVERFRRGYRDPGSAEYQGYVVPMRRIRSALDITYLYTQNLAAGDSVQYIVDSTPGEDHSPIGAREALETESDIRGLADVMDRGVVYSSGIEDSEEWGLLKSAYAPVVGPQGVAVGMVGTDISVSTIQDRTQLALAKVGLVTVVILFLGGLGSVLISLRLTGPLAALQEGASRVAAGRMGKPIDPPRLQDLAALTRSFNDMTRMLTSSVDELREETHRVVTMRTRRHLGQELAARITTRGGLPTGVTVTAAPGAHEEIASGRLAVVGPEQRPRVVAWLRSLDGDALTVLAQREEMALLARRATATAGDDPDALLRTMERYWNVEAGTLMVVDVHRGAVSVASDAGVPAVVQGPDGAQQSVVLRGGSPFLIPVGHELVVSLESPGPDAPGGWTLRIRGARA